MIVPHFNELTGRSDKHVQEIILNNFSLKVHQLIIDDLRQWEQACQKQGIDFAVASGFRSYDRQLLLWNEKIEGKRPLKNAQGDIVDPKTLSDSEILEHVLLWSHIPGVSRHHWGTDLDIFDASWYKLHQQTLSLENVDFLEGGPSARLHSFNEQLLQKKQWSAFPFFRPYELGNNFMRELWHYSHRPMATIFLQAYSFDIFVKNLQLSQQLLLRDLLLDNAHYYYKKFVTVR